MLSRPTLTETETFLLSAAAQESDGVLPSTRVRTASQRKALARLVDAELLAADEQPLPGGETQLRHHITPAGLKAIGIEGNEISAASEAASEDVGHAPLTSPVKEEASAPSGKLGLLIGLLKREGGLQLTEAMKQTGWQAHTVRATFSRLRKRDFAITATRSAPGCTTYRMASLDEVAGDD